MLSILTIVLPVFGIVALGYGAVRLNLFPAEGVKGLLVFVINFATPCLLFDAMLDADFAAVFRADVIVPFFVGALACLVVGILLARREFAARPGESVTFGVSAMLTNTVLIGIPIIHRAYGEEATAVAYSIIGFHSPILMTVGMLTMELMRRDGEALGKALANGALRVFQNPLLWGIAAGVAANLLGITVAEPVEAIVDTMKQAVLPTALFGLGAALHDYKLAEDWVPAAVLAGLKLLVHPAIAWVLMVPVLGVDPHVARYGVLLAAMPSALNVYIFATQYDRAPSVAATTVLISTVASVVTVSVWLFLLGP